MKKNQDIYTNIRSRSKAVSNACIRSGHEFSWQRADVMSLLKRSTRCLRVEEVLLNSCFIIPVYGPLAAQFIHTSQSLRREIRRRDTCRPGGEGEGRNSQMHSLSGLLGNISMVTVKAELSSDHICRLVSTAWDRRWSNASKILLILCSLRMRSCEGRFWYKALHKHGNVLMSTYSRTI